MTCAHQMYIKGIELIYYEFKELVLELANIVGAATGTYVAGKPKTVLKKFLDDYLFKRLMPYVRFYNPTATAEASKVREWPESEKDRKIREIQEAKAQREAEEAARLAEEEAQRAAMSEEKGETPQDVGPTQEELDAQAAEEAKRAAEEAAAMAQDADEGEDEEASAAEDDYGDEEDDDDF